MEAGRSKLVEAQQKGKVVAPETASQGQELVKEELEMLTNDFQGFESDLGDLNNTLSEYNLTFCKQVFDYVVRFKWLNYLNLCFDAITDLVKTILYLNNTLSELKSISQQCTE